MKNYDIFVDVIPPQLAVYDLYNEVGWSRYCADLSKLMRALEGSLCVVTAWQGDVLRGLCRAVGDGESILFIQDLLVSPAHRRRGIGKTLLRVLLDNYPHVTRYALIADNTRFLRDFYAARGFSVCEGRGLMSLFRDQTP